MDSELVRVNVVGFGSTNVFTVDRGVMGTVASTFTVGAALTIRKGQYIIRDDVVFFDSPPLSGVTTEFNFIQLEFLQVLIGTDSMGEYLID